VGCHHLTKILQASPVHRPRVAIQRIREQHKECTNAQISRILGEEWKKLHPTEKKKYKDRAEIERTAFEDPSYVFTPATASKRRKVSRSSSAPTELPSSYTTLVQSLQQANASLNSLCQNKPGRWCSTQARSISRCKIVESNTGLYSIY